MTTADSISEEAAWQAVSRRNARFDGRFVFAVTSTGIYCRPSCPARRPRRDNVRFFASPVEAEAGGFRACKRCRPDQASREEQAVTAALTLIAQSAERLALSELSRTVGYSPAHFQRVFTRALGVSPAAYQRAILMERASVALSDGASVTRAVAGAGYGAPSRFYEAGKERLGMSPSVWRDGGAGATIRWAVVDTSLGRMLVAATDRGVCRLAFGESGKDLAHRFPHAKLEEADDAFTALLAEVMAQVETPGRAHSIPLDVRGTAFQEAVWAQLKKIPPGETRSYAEIAAATGQPGAVRATGSANGANHVAVLIPCHRVIRTDGSLGGYAYGLDIKRELLARERSRD